VSTVHASCVTFGGRGLLIRGESGAGKSRLAHLILLRAPLYGISAQLVADDRVALTERDGGLFARAPEALAGLLEVRGLGLVRMPFERETRLDLVIDLQPQEDIPRLPAGEELQADINGVTLPRCFGKSPESSLDVLLTIWDHAHNTLETNSALASVTFDGKTVRP
jgi:HPr kinase/phosphorylase